MMTTPFFTICKVSIIIIIIIDNNVLRMAHRVSILKKKQTG